VKKTRTNSDIVAKYKAQFGGLSGVFGNMRLPAEDHRRKVATAVELFCGGWRHINPLHCDVYLKDSIYRWVLGSCRSDKSRVAYLVGLSEYIAWSQHNNLSQFINRLNRHQVVDYVAYLRPKLAERTIQNRLKVLGAFWSWLIDVELTDRANPITRRVKRLAAVDQTRVTKGDGTRQSLTLREAGDLLAEAVKMGHLPFACMALMLGTGARIGELAKLQWRHVVESESATTLTIHGKGNKTRKIPLESVALAGLVAARLAMTDRKRKNGFLIPRSDARMCQWIKAAAKAIGRPEISSHDLRKTHATLLLEGGVATLEQVQRRLGHSDPQLTLRCYTTRHRELEVTTNIQLPEGLS